jgi:hypothetical protein
VLNQVVQERTLSQADAAKVLRIRQPEVSALRQYKLAGFSVERLTKLLTAVNGMSRASFGEAAFEEGWSDDRRRVASRTGTQCPGAIQEQPR